MLGKRMRGQSVISTRVEEFDDVRRKSVRTISREKAKNLYARRRIRECDGVVLGEVRINGYEVPVARPRSCWRNRTWVIVGRGCKYRADRYYNLVG